MEPVVQALQEKYQDEIVFLIIDVEKQNDPAVAKLAQEFQARYIPAFFLVDGKGQVVKDYVGVVSKQALTEVIEEMII